MVHIRFLFCFFILQTIFSQHSFSLLYAQERPGLRDIQIRSEKVVTAWLGYTSTFDMNVLKNTNLYTITSLDDVDFENGVNPTVIYRFAKGSYANDDHPIFDFEERLDNWMHCVLPYKLKPGKNYKLTLGAGLISSEYAHSMDFSLYETPNPSFKLNQVGYSNKARKKYIYLSSYLGDGLPIDLSGLSTFEVRTTSDHSVVLNGTIEHISDNDPQGNDKLYRLNISSLSQSGEFYIWVDGIGRSYNFINGEEAPKEIFNIISKGFYFQRSGTAIEMPWAESWPRPMAHNKIYVTTKNIIHPWTEGETNEVVDPSDPASGDWYVPDGSQEFHGGHYDAGDYDMYITHVNIGERLMTLFEALPDNFYDGQVYIPESGNGIPDILDEVAWNLKAWEYFQDYATNIRGLNGGIASGIESYRHPIGTTGSEDTLPYWLRKATPYSSFAGAGLFAKAARVFRPYDSNKADEYLSRAIRAYNWAIDNYDISWSSELPYSLVLPEKYDEANLRVAKMWAAGEMFSTTGELKYQDVFKEIFYNGYFAGVKEDIFWAFQWFAPLWAMASTKQENVDKTLQNHLKSMFIEKADMYLDTMERNAQNGYYAMCHVEGEFGRSSPLHRLNSLVINRAFYLTKKQKYYDAIASNVDFVLGMNPSEFSWMTGAGSVYPMDIRNNNCKWDGVDEPYPGIVFYGPTSDYNSWRNLLYPDKSTMGYFRRIADIWTADRACEYTVHEQQVGMMVAAGILLTGDVVSKIKQPVEQKFSTTIYPNPFSSEVRILLKDANVKNAQITIYNILGKKITTLEPIYCGNNECVFLWNGKDNSCNQVVEGIYLARIKLGNEERTYKLLKK